MNSVQNTNVSEVYMLYKCIINIFSLSTQYTSMLYLAAPGGSKTHIAEISPAID